MPLRTGLSNSLFLIFIFLVNSCDERKDDWWDSPERIFTEDIQYSEKSAAIFTKRSYDLPDKEVTYISNLEFYSPQDPQKTLYRFKHRGPVSGGDEYTENILSPDKKWIVLKAGNSDGFVYSRTDDIVDCVKNDCYEGNFHLLHPSVPHCLFVKFLRWEAPATFVFFDVDREAHPDHKLRNPAQDIYKINLETGEFTLPPEHLNGTEPRLYREKEGERMESGNEPEPDIIGRINISAKTGTLLS